MFECLIVGYNNNILNKIFVFIDSQYFFLINRKVQSISSFLAQWSTKHLIDNDPEDRYLYKISVETGFGLNSGTESNVYFVLIGDKQTEVKALRDESNKVSY